MTTRITATTTSSRTIVGITRLPTPNILSRNDLNNLAARPETFDADRKIGAVLLHGASREFCGGLDLGEFDDPEGHRDLAVALERCFLAFARLSKPLVVSVDGLACGFGATMLCHADVVIASERSRIRMPFLDLGLLPEAGSTLLLGERIGHLNAFRMICLAEEIDATEAKQFGLVTKIEPPNKVETRAADAAFCLARRPLELLCATRDLMKRPREDVIERIRVEVALCLERLRDPDVQRRLSRIASLKKAPRFKPVHYAGARCETVA